MAFIRPSRRARKLGLAASLVAEFSGLLAGEVLLDCARDDPALSTVEAIRGPLESLAELRRKADARRYPGHSTL
jgi:hypothetical protein